jgi:hypothetical protein
MLRSITRKQLNEWWAFYRLEPFGDGWKQTAKITAAVLASRGGKYNPDLFMPAGHHAGQQRKTSKQMRNVFAAFVAHHNAALKPSSSKSARASPRPQSPTGASPFSGLPADPRTPPSPDSPPTRLLTPEASSDG